MAEINHDPVDWRSLFGQSIYSCHLKAVFVSSIVSSSCLSRYMSSTNVNKNAVRLITMYVHIFLHFQNAATLNKGQKQRPLPTPSRNPNDTHKTRALHYKNSKTITTTWQVYWANYFFSPLALSSIVGRVKPPAFALPITFSAHFTTGISTLIHHHTNIQTFHCQ